MVENKENKTKKEETRVGEKMKDKKVSETAEKKEVKKKEIVKKDIAVANGYALKISPKQSIYVCRLLKGKSPEKAVERLQEVLDEKRPVPMASLEVGHKKGKGLAGGKFPKNACKAIIEVVKQANANAIVNGIEDPIIFIAQANKASAPYKTSGRKAKRAHIHIEVKERRAKK